MYRYEIQLLKIYNSNQGLEEPLRLSYQRSCHYNAIFKKLVIEEVLEDNIILDDGEQEGEAMNLSFSEIIEPNKGDNNQESSDKCDEPVQNILKNAFKKAFQLVSNGSYEDKLNLITLYNNEIKRIEKLPLQESNAIIDFMKEIKIVNITMPITSKSTLESIFHEPYVQKVNENGNNNDVTLSDALFDGHNKEKEVIEEAQVVKKGPSKYFLHLIIESMCFCIRLISNWIKIN